MQASELEDGVSGWGAESEARVASKQSLSRVVCIFRRPFARGTQPRLRGETPRSAAP